MRAIPFDQAHANLEKTMDQVCNDRDPVIIMRENDRSVVLISLEDFGSLEETAHLLRSPKNAERLFESIEELENGKGLEKELVD